MEHERTNMYRLTKYNTIFYDYVYTVFKVFLVHDEKNMRYFFQTTCIKYNVEVRNT